MTMNIAEMPLTIASVTKSLHEIGVVEGMTLIVHSSMKSMNRWIVGGESAIVLALEQALGNDGTLVMPTHTPNLTDPSGWCKPPVPEPWWSIIKTEMPPFEVDLTPSTSMGAIVECFRKQNGTLRSSHPQTSFAARGKQASFITEEHSLHYGIGEQSPIARIYDKDGWVLLLGVGYSNNTSLHLSELRADYASKVHMKQGAPCVVDGKREWITFDDLDFDSDDFEAIGEAFERETNAVKIGKIGDATVRLMRQRDVVDFGVKWMETNRK
ncbi:aminoglycoside N(3)-acetyltransferase [Paenibacillus sp. L3-i20]|uniref:aminoglycoside N(3)-acetyltransferase n=1 Tax=Paenibacillus sp. L3-i20 TaxID=2905833 RepID=UPI0020866BFD|nr:AAC(3) family N-acetyltransferase [Paenibacillus sp. L3-i20]GKU76324.1 AAC(3) family N-acetyltransferase [Paenibacillus sp. L3-i20]